ncbi:MAG: DUF2304 domain-containing protein [Eggerthellaceae bacterium]|nr:DUF2304 domain-containing protein [Eggerthellaceae bacterium]
MNLTLTIVLVIGALIVFLGIVWKIRKAELSIASSVFWFLFTISLLLLAFFPQIAYFFSHLFNIESPSNFVFLYVIAVLLVRSFMDTIQITKLHEKHNDIVQEQALASVCPPDPSSDGDGGDAK